MGAGEHTFDVRAVDGSNNRQVPPTRFTWTIGDPATLIQDLINDVRNLDGVSFFTKALLISQLRFALYFVNNGNDLYACATMNIFISTVDSNEKRGRLTEAQAGDLIQQAEAIRDAIGCSFSSSQAAAEIASSTNVNNIPSPALSIPR